MKAFETAFSALAGIGLPVMNMFSNATKTAARFIPFSGNGLGFPSDNSYPQVLAKMAANTSTHGSALNKKALFTYGQGFDYTEMSVGLADSFKNVNEDNENLNDILSKVSKDYSTFGGFCMKVSWSHGKKIVAMEHVPFKTVRLSVPDSDGKIRSYVVANDWEQKMHDNLRFEYVINKFDPTMISGEAPIKVDGEYRTDGVTEANSEQLIYFKDYCPASDGFYPLPDYVSALDSIFTEIEIGISMLMGIKNGLNGAYLISTDGTTLDDKSKQDIIDSLSSLATGAENTGGIVLLPNEVTVHALDAIPADTFLAINPEIRQRIITAHGIPAILLEYSQSGGFNDRASEMEVAIRQFQQTAIKGYQNSIVRVFNSILGWYTDEDVVLAIMPFLPNEEASETTVEIKDEASIEV